MRLMTYHNINYYFFCFEIAGVYDSGTEVRSAGVHYYVFV